MRTQLASWLSFFLCYFTYHNIHFSSVSGRCLEDQKSLLMQMKNNLTVDPVNSNLALWNPHHEADCCQWHGVSCDKEGRVIGLDLSWQFISGRLTNYSSLFSLQNLEKLDLSFNYIDSVILSGFHKLTGLRSVSLSHSSNNLSAPLLEFFAKFSNLTTLDLSSCPLNGLFPQDIFKVQTLTSPDISFNPDLQGYLPDFTQDGSLQILILSNTNFAGAFPDSIVNLKNLSRLECSYCQFNGTLPDSISKLTELTYLDLSFNNFAGPIPSFGRAKKLTYIDLSHNHFSGVIPSSLFSLPLLQVVQLSNKFDRVNELSFLSNSTLESIDLSSNNLGGPIPTSVFHLNKLDDLQLSSNNFSGILNLDKIHYLETLYYLDLSYNNLSIDVDITEGDLFPFPYVASLNLAACKLSKFPVFLRNLSHLIDLDLSNNQMQGKLPNWIWTLGSLSKLNVSHNLLTGLEGPLQNLSTILVVVDLHSNKLHSSIPPSLCTCPYKVLDLSYNNFVGRIPRCLVENDILVVLNLQDNKLNGNIPDTFSESCALRTLHLHGNQLNGPLPKSLVNFKELEVLDLGRNHINDVFPFFLMNISTLRVIILRENKFQGLLGCPTMTGSSQMLQIVDLAFNNFSGKLPGQCFSTWKSMKLSHDKAISNLDYIQYQSIGSVYYQDTVMVTFKGLEMQLAKILTIFTSIDFSSNLFEGFIPEELMNFKALYVLNLSHNSLPGQIPSSIGNLSELESLDLSNNLLNGEIPTQLANLNFLSVLNLSSNNLVGRIPIGNQIQTFEETSFKGNELCGPPLTKNCNTPMPVESNSTTMSSFSWNFIGSELGFIFGIGMIFLPLLFWKQWRLWNWKFIDGILYSIFPQLDFVHECHGGKNYRTLRWKRH